LHPALVILAIESSTRFGLQCCTGLETGGWAWS
jgi:hypothetical protein